MTKFTEKLTYTQLATIKALGRRGKPAPQCDGFLFLNSTMVSKLADVLELVRRGLMYRLEIEDQSVPMYYLTRNGKKLASIIK